MHIDKTKLWKADMLRLRSGRMEVFGRSVPLPASRLARIILGGVFAFFGLFGFLPILGFWMVPVGLLILSIDIPRVRRWRRKGVLRWNQRPRRRRRAEPDLSWGDDGPDRDCAGCGPDSPLDPHTVAREVRLDREPRRTLMP